MLFITLLLFLQRFYGLFPPNSTQRALLPFRVVDHSRFFVTFYAMSRKKTSRKPTLLFFIQRRWFLPVLLGCYDILMDVIICNTLWYLIRPIGRLLKIAFCEM